MDGLLGQVRDAVNRLGQVEQELDSVLKDPAKWRGRSTTEFYTVVRRMAANAGVTKGCLFGVQAALSGWSALLAEYQRNGQSLEQQARQARDRLHRAKNSPDLHLDPLSIGMTGGDATGHPDRVQRNLAAKAELEAADNELDGIIRAGRNVKHMHDESAKSSAGEIKRAVKALTGDEWRGGHIYPNPAVVYPGAIPGAPAFMDDPDWDYKMAGDVYFGDGPPRPGHSRVELSGPVVPGNGITVLRFFIPSDQAAFSLLEGDARGFDTTPGAPSRMTLAWDSDTGRVVFDVAPSTTTGPVVDQGKIDAHEVKPGGANDIRLRPNNAGTGFSADITGLNALLPSEEPPGPDTRGPARGRHPAQAARRSVMSGVRRCVSVVAAGIVLVAGCGGSPERPPDPAAVSEAKSAALTWFTATWRNDFEAACPNIKAGNVATPPFGGCGMAATNLWRSMNPDAETLISVTSPSSNSATTGPGSIRIT
ncbi:hypothetical protein [Embleya sp. MST-111070]|uniref:hypothetical protein n=1 Tax=Embleya sp. MST-111070 TaxID=3398231 RepID=UPI003F735248